MSKGLKISVFLHLAILLLLFLGFSFPKKYNGKQLITNVDIVRIDKKTNLKPAVKKGDKVVKSKGKSKSKSHKKSKAKKQSKKTPKPPKKTIKKKAPQKPKPPKKQQTSEVDEFLKDISKKPMSEKTDNSVKKEQKLAATGASNYDPATALTISQIEYLRNKITINFDSPVLYHFAPGEVVIELKLNLNLDGSVNTVTLLPTSTYSKQYKQIFHSLANNLIRACYKAAPFDNLPKELYSGSNGWNEVIISFDASNLMNG